MQASATYIQAWLVATDPTDVPYGRVTCLGWRRRGNRKLIAKVAVAVGVGEWTTSCLPGERARRGQRGSCTENHCTDGQRDNSDGAARSRSAHTVARRKGESTNDRTVTVAVVRFRQHWHVEPGPNRGSALGSGGSNVDLGKSWGTSCPPAIQPALSAISRHPRGNESAIAGTHIGQPFDRGSINGGT